MMVFSWADFSLARYGDYIYPDWANALGWVITMTSSVVSVAYVIYRVAKEKGSFIEVSLNKLPFFSSIDMVRKKGR